MRSEENNIRTLENDFTRMRSQQQSFDGGGGGGYDSRMEERVKKLEAAAEKTTERLGTIERDLAVVKSNYATKEDIKNLGMEFHRELHATTWKVIGAMGLICAAVFWMARNIEPPRLAANLPQATSSPPAAATHPTK